MVRPPAPSSIACTVSELGRNANYLKMRGFNMLEHLQAQNRFPPLLNMLQVRLMETPPSASSAEPVTKLEASDARKSTARAISSGSAIRFRA